MYEFFSANSIYIVFFIVLIIWAGIAAFLVKVDGKLTKIERRIELESKE